MFKFTSLIENLNSVAIMFITAFCLFVVIESTLFVLDKVGIALPSWFNKKIIIPSGILILFFIIYSIINLSAVDGIFNAAILTILTTGMSDIIKAIVKLVKALFNKIFKKD